MFVIHRFNIKQTGLIKPLRSLLLGLLVSSAIALPVKAQISPDDTTNTTVTPIDNGIRIDAGNRTGDNLFHSFQEFSVSNGSEAFFNNANDIVNIFSRVTGGNISSIDGLIRANGEANLFLINPAGIIFGENASLNIGGSFFSSTAESIVFSDDVEFSATDTNNPPLLTINMPIGLNFGNNPGEIAVNGSNLQVNNGETFALFGGNLTITGGQIIAPGANIELGGLTEAGQISFEQLEAISFPESIARGDVTLTDGAEVNVQAAGGGGISVNARNLELSGASNLTTGIAPESNSVEAVAGDLSIDATGDITLSQESGINNRVEESGVGNAGNITINTDSLEATNRAVIDASTRGLGNAGAIGITANETVSFHNDSYDSYVFSRVNGGAEGNSGGINITTGSLNLTDGGQLNADTFGQGNGADIIVNARDSVNISGVGSFASGLYSNNADENAVGDAGNITINTGSLEAIDEAVIDASTRGLGNAGAISITANETVSFHNDSFVFSRVNGNAEGNSGGINITTGSLNLTNGGQLITDIFGQGDGADIIVNAKDSVNISGFGSFASGLYSNNASENAVGDAGNITINTDSLEATDGAVIITSTRGLGNAGEIDINTTNLSLSGGGLVSASTSGQGDAGKITIEAWGTISLEGEDSSESSNGIFSNVESTGEGDSGGIEITTSSLFVTNNAEISAQTSGEGAAGTLLINASDFVEVSGLGSGLFNRTGGTGDAGTLIITTPELKISDNGQIGVNNFIETGFEIETSTDNSGDSITRVVPIFNSSKGSGNAGTLEITTSSLQLEDGGNIAAESAGGDGGNIKLIVDEILLLEGNNNSISSKAGLQATGGDGGNIEIDANFIIASPNQNNDIIASAGQGDGGNIDITTNSIFGLEERSSTPENNTNDIDASSEFGLDGTVEINELDTNPVEGLEELPKEVIDVTRLIAQSLCQQGDVSEFIVTGKGGIAPSPNQMREWEVSEVDLVEPAWFSEDGRDGNREGPFAVTGEDGEEIVEAQGWIINDRGIVELVAHQTDLNGSSPQPKDNNVCNK